MAKNKVQKTLHFRYLNLVGGFNPFEEYARQIGWFPQIEVNTKHIWNQPVKFG